MIRELDDVSLAFSIWEQARQAVRAAEEQLLQLRKRPHTAAELAQLQADLLRLRAQADRLRDEAIAALRRHSEAIKRRDKS